MEEEKEKLKRELEEEKRSRDAADKAKKDSNRTEIVEPQPDPRSTVISSQTEQNEVYQIQIQFTNGPLAGQSFLVNNGMSIGRASDNDLVIAENTVSGKHCRLDFAQNQYYVNDLGSTNGTVVNGEKVSKCALKQGDKMSLGSIEIVVK